MIETNKIYNEDCLETMKQMPNNFLDSIVTDPPYGLSFMGKKWDYEVPSVEIWKECLRVLKPGGYLLAFAGTRTQHRMACNIEDAGFEIRDMIAWVYGSGFPKSLDIGKAVDKLEGNEREDLGESPAQRLNMPTSDIYEAGIRGRECRITKGHSDWEGWGTALKPALEPITVARKPLSENTIAENVLKWGTGGINIDASRIETNDEIASVEGGIKRRNKINQSQGFRPYEKGFDNQDKEIWEQHSKGRFPANFLHDGSEEVVSLFPETGKSQGGRSGHTGAYSGGFKQEYYNDLLPGFGDSGSAARFFYCAKASKSERNAGLNGMEEKFFNDLDKMGGEKCGMKTGSGNPRNGKNQNNHPTVKPVTLIKYLIQLVTKPNGLVYDPFGGSGTLKLAAQELKMNWIISEIDKDYCLISENRELPNSNQMSIFDVIESVL